MRANDSFSACEKDGLYKAIFSRRDVRSHFINKEIPNDILAKILNAAHHEPSVGFSQHWSIILIKANEIRQQVKDSFVGERKNSIIMLDSDKAKKKINLALKLAV